MYFHNYFRYESNHAADMYSLSVLHKEQTRISHFLLEVTLNEKIWSVGYKLQIEQRGVEYFRIFS